MITGVGMLLGTAAYMSPEQARGLAVDKRSDIWAFGCVLYEMLTGKQAFASGNLSDAVAAVLRSEPDWGALPADTPAGSACCSNVVCTRTRGSASMTWPTRASKSKIATPMRHLRLLRHVRPAFVVWRGSL